MKNNRQIGLDGKSFVSSSLKRGTIFVLMLLLCGAVTAASDILKLTGSSGAVMSTFTTTLLIYDFIVSLLLIVVVFYAYFLECGLSVPVLRHKPLLVFGFFRLGYYILLAYYICYRSLYCLTHTDTVRFPMVLFYSVYFVLIFCCILANCFIYNILTRNTIRRSYKKTFHTLASVGIVMEVLMPITYIIARVTLVDSGDEFFTSAFCDFMRLCVCPLLLTGVWFLFLHSIKQIDEVFGEVDDALRNKRYQITYGAITDGKTDKTDQKKESAKPVAAAAFLPAPSKTVSVLPAPADLSAQASNMAASGQAARQAPKIASPAEIALASMSSEERKAVEATITDAATVQQQKNYRAASVPAPAAPKPVIDPIEPVRIPEQSLTHDGGTTLAYVADMRPVELGGQPGVQAIPLVQEFDPFPETKAPMPKKQVQAKQTQARQKGSAPAKPGKKAQPVRNDQKTGQRGVDTYRSRTGQSGQGRGRAGHR